MLKIIVNNYIELFLNIILFLFLAVIIYVVQSPNDRTLALEKSKNRESHNFFDIGIKEDKAYPILDENGNYISDLGIISKITLPNKRAIEIGDKSTESKLLFFLESDFPVNSDMDKGWITCDRIFFRSGSTKVANSSIEQIENIFEILKAYPFVKIRIGGHTDSSGSSKSNQKISLKRAEVIKDKLIEYALDSARISHEGYGENFPISSNQTALGRAKNRRIDIRVMEK